MIPKFIKNIGSRLKDELPGKKSQDKMKPLRINQVPPSMNHGKAGVLILIYPSDGELQTILIKRTEYPGPHSGQISFPGGKLEKTDKSLIMTAIRETGEETGIDISNIKVLGTLSPLIISASNLEVLPVVGYTEIQPEFRINHKEVKYLIHTSLKHLMRCDLKTEKNLRIGTQAIRAPGYSIKGEFVWGATAMILSEFVEVLMDAVAANQ